MIRPQPEADLSLNILVLGSEVIKAIKNQKGESSIHKLLKKFLKKDNRRTHRHFFDTLTFLFTINAIEEKDYNVEVVKYDTQKTLL